MGLEQTPEETAIIEANNAKVLLDDANHKLARVCHIIDQRGDIGILPLDVQTWWTIHKVNYRKQRAKGNGRC